MIYTKDELKELYVGWLNEERADIEKLLEDSKGNGLRRIDILKDRIEEFTKIIFEKKSKISVLESFRDNEINTLSPELKAQRAKLITEPNIKVNFGADPREKSVKKSKPKESVLDIASMGKNVKAEMLAKIAELRAKKLGK